MFDLFDTKSTGTCVTRSDIVLLLATILTSKKKRQQATSFTINNAEEDRNEEEEDLVWKKEAEEMLLPTSSTTTVTRETFCTWASANLDASLLLDVFRVFPTKEGQLVKNLFYSFFHTHTHLHVTFVAQ